MRSNDFLSKTWYHYYGGIMRIHFLKGVWKDIIILENDKNIAFIDTGYKEDYEQIREYLKSIGKKDISFILLTHFHRDHYGCIPFLVKKYNVDKVYFKEYSGLDKTTATGKEADNEYRKSERKKCEEIKTVIRNYSKLIEVEKINSIKFGEVELKLFNNQNSMKEIFEDESCLDYYHKYSFNENQNSLVAFMKVNGVNVYFGGDVYDNERVHHLANYNNRRAALLINEEIDIYKVPHHGTNYCNSRETLDIFKPKIAVITNGEDYLSSASNVVDDLMKSNKEMKIFLTEKNNIVIDIDKNGNIKYEELD